MNDTENKYYQQLSREIEFLLNHISGDFNEIIRELGSVDIPVAKKIYDKYMKESEKYDKNRSELHVKRLNARSQTSYFIYNLPAPNSLFSQWWFSLDSIEKIAFQIKRLSNSNTVAFLGVPSVAFFYKKCFNNSIKVFDVDEDIIATLDDNGIDAEQIDILTECISEKYYNKFDVVFMDPPWYEKHMNQFLEQASLLLKQDGYILASIPSQFTRPGIIDSRQKYIKLVYKKNMHVLAINNDYFEYVIPDFENEMLSKSEANIDRPWRKSDLLILQCNGESKINFDKSITNDKISAFHLKNQGNQFRIFLKYGMCCNTQKEWFKFVKEFSEDVSTRRNMNESIHLWTSNQIGFSIKDNDLAYKMLSLWQDGKTLQEVSQVLEEGYENITAELEKLNKIALLWRSDTSNSRRTPKMLLETNKYSPLAAEPSKRRYSQKNDGFRLEFQRDRDRVIWSESFRKLANKCQVFSFEHDEISNVRTRLTHSIEVMQLASTIGNSFGLNRDLIEAGALCHDIGHTPFGHGGECALNNILNDISNKFGGFNHYEHGLDIVEYLESPYSSVALGGFSGLNLMQKTLECIAKHTFTKEGKSFSQDGVYKKSKHQKIINSHYGSLESQTVRIADKISYMLSDIEDGAKMGAIRYENIIDCRLFNKAPIDFNSVYLSNSSDSFYNHFISQRRAILKLVMEDVLTASEKRLVRIKNYEEIKEAESYLIGFSSDMQDCLNEIWDKLQAGLLHKDSRVNAANFRAAQIISSLFYLYAFSPDLIDLGFRNNHEFLKCSKYIEYYNGKLNKKTGIAKHKVSQYNFNLMIGKEVDIEGDNYMIPTYNIILAKDYVASLTDQRAIKEYHTHFGFTE